MEAVKSNPYAIVYVEEEFQTKELCLEAVKRDINALRFIKKLTPNLLRYLYENIWKIN